MLWAPSCDNLLLKLGQARLEFQCLPPSQQSFQHPQVQLWLVKLVLMTEGRF